MQSTNTFADIGRNLIKSRLPDTPQLPGVYRMLDEHGQILYIGKAKNLKKRLSNYAKIDLMGRIARMIFHTRALEYSVTNSEAEALLLEAQLIKKYQPKFNILLKDDKSFPYIKLREDHPYPQLLKYRGKRPNNGKLFGPFASSFQINITLNELQKIFRLRTCTDSYFASRQRPCLQYQIKRCYGPCVGKISKPDYDEIVAQTEDFLSGRTAKLQDMLSKKMEILSENMHFEQAAEIRDRIKALSYVQLKSNVQYEGISDADVIAIAEENNTYCIQIFLYRTSQSWGNKAYFPVHTDESNKAEVLESFIGQFYQTRIPPKEIIINQPLLQPNLIVEALDKLYSFKTKIVIPKRGNRMKLAENAYDNAKIALEQFLKNSIKNQTIFAEIKDLFGLTELPHRIEVYDNSHIMGTHAVGAMIVATPLGFDKSQYRIFNIKGLSTDKTTVARITGDDYAMLREVLTRRLNRLAKEPDKKPSLMIIDGGKGHMSVVREVIDKLKIENLDFVCMSKGVDRNSGREQFHVPNKDPFTLDKNKSLMKYLQILRDEAHNFAIKNHRAGRSRAIKISSLDQIANIGEIRKKALLNYFGDFKAISNATVNELTNVHGINKSIAEQIFKTLHPEIK
ncbi:MAG: excinuclease ABC subunit UvrC [Rickettsiaceae bacterium]|nr:MAG: excinuclease ABC subunit UvrC [Rickettsiaceae bacterium]